MKHPAVLASPVAFALACVGTIDAPGDSPAGSPSSTVRPPPARVDLVLQLPEPRLRRLTAVQFRNTIADLLGPGLTDAAEIPGDHRIDERGFTSAGATEAIIGRTDVERFEELALSYAAQVFASDARRRELVRCDPDTANNPCLRTFLEVFGRRAWRRPLSTEELATLLQLTTDLAADGGVWPALELTVAALLQSPHFLYRVELGEPAQGDTRVVVGYEMASRLSFALLERGPDDALLDAAAAAELDSAEGVRRYAEQLIEDPRAVPAVQRFFAEYLQLGALQGLHRDPDVFPDFDPSLATAFRQEVDHLVEDAVFDRARSFTHLLTDRRAFVDQALADHYGVGHPGGSEMVAVDLPADGPRAGILATAGFLASHAAPEETSPVRRGWFIRLALLCEEVPAPPPEVQANFPVVDLTQTMRERFEQHAADPACRGCHDALDPLGLPMEEFDAVGAYRTTDRGKELDLSGDLDGVTFSGTAAMGEALAADSRVAPCMTAHLVRYFAGLPPWPEEEAIGATILEDAAAHDIRSLLSEISTSDVFRYSGKLEVE